MRNGTPELLLALLAIASSSVVSAKRSPWNGRKNYFKSMVLAGSQEALCNKFDPITKIYCLQETTKLIRRWKKKEVLEASSVSRWQENKRSGDLHRISKDLEENIKHFLARHVSNDSKQNPESLISKTEDERGYECCPIKREVVEPRGGINREGKYVNLVTAPNSRQRFYEERCDEDRLPSPVPYCRNITTSHRNIAVCLQEYSYSYALVTDEEDRSDKNTDIPPIPRTWHLDFIQIPSGCSCRIWPKRFFTEKLMESRAVPKEVSDGIGEEERENELASPINFQKERLFGYKNHY